MPPSAASPSARPANALPAGTRLGEFEILEVLGIGGFGIVYRAMDHALERAVAIKEYMPAALAGRTETLQVSLRSQSDAETFALGLRSFVNEAKLLARFDHPSLLKVYRFWEQNETAYMAMPVYQGRTLKEVRQALSGPPEEAWLRALLVPLLGAIETLHGEGVYHRDIAPDNILVEPDGRPVLLDFGAARRVIGDRSQTLTAILKPAYAPIEQYAEVSAARQGPWTDLYALGATLHYVLTGAPPSPATARTLHDDVLPLAQRGLPGCSPGFLAAIDWMLATRPSDRPQSVAALRAVLDGRAAAPVPPTIVAPPTTPPPMTPADDATLFDVSAPWPQGPTAVSSTGPAAAADATMVDLGARGTGTAAAAAASGTTPPVAAPAAVADGWGGDPGVRRLLPLLLGGLAVAAAAAWWWTSRPAPVDPPADPSTAAAPAASAQDGASALPGVAAETHAGKDAASPPPAATTGATGATDAIGATGSDTLPAGPAAATARPAADRTGSAHAESPPEPAARKPLPARAEPEPRTRAETRPEPVPVMPARVDAPALATTPTPPPASPPAPAVARSPAPASAAVVLSDDASAVCGGRVLLALFWCMERKCASTEFKDHPACRKWFSTNRQRPSP